VKIWRLPGLFVLRALVRELTQIRQTLALQTTILSRLADQFAPITPDTDPSVVKSETGVDYSDNSDQYLIQEYAARTYTATGHMPTDDEVLSYLADEKTRDLHQRLIDKDEELARLSREGRG
jgi:hypothetical protein